MEKRFLTGLFILMIANFAFAAPKVVLDVVAEKEIVVEENGKQVVKRVSAEQVEPGENIFYILKYRNEGDETALNVAFKNKIPENTEYVSGTASGEGSAILYSIDQGKTFNEASLLVYEVTNENGKKVKKVVSPEKYTDIKWIVSEVPSGSSGELGFQVKVN